MSPRSSVDVTGSTGVLEPVLTDEVGVFFTSARLDGCPDANLAHHVPHVPERLACARTRVAELTGTDAGSWHLMRQVHGARVAVIDDSVPTGAELRDVDVLVTTLPGRPLVVLAADCLPIVAVGRRAIAVAHAGWRGIVAGVPDVLVDALCGLGERCADLSVVIGPAIGPCCYAVGPDVSAAVLAVAPDAGARTRDGHVAVDLRAAAHARLRARGVADVRDFPWELGDGAACTACDGRWFSHRRDPRSGRQAGIVVRRHDTAVGGAGA